MTTQLSRLVIEIDSRNALRNAQAIGRELENIDRNGTHASRSMDSVSVATRQLAGHMAGLLTVGAAVAKMDAYTGMQNRLKLVTESQEQLNLAMSDTFVIAQKSYQSWDSVIQVYQRFSDNAKTLKIDMAKTAELTETVSKAVAISGASTQAAEAALTQFGQALASGTLRGEELNSILEQTPALAKAIAQGMGITVGQLRSVAAEGKITGEVLVDALAKSKESVDELFAKTDVTIGQSLQLLSNEVTKFTGEAGKASGAATTIANGIQLLANNLDAIAGIAMVGGAALLTKTILAQAVAIRGTISATLERRAADTAALQSQIQLAAVEVQRTRQVAALALTEINLARQELNSATTRQARAAATMRLTQAEIAHNIAIKQSTAAVVTQTAAENALNASRSRGAMLLGLVGGPIGAITIGVAALTAGYMYLQKRTAEANAKLEEQGKVAEKTKEELLALKGVQLDVAKDDLAASFEDQNDKLNKLNLSFNGFIRTVKNANAGNKEVREISDQVHKGLMSQADAIERLNKLKLLTPEQKSQGLDLIKSYEEARVKAQQNADAQKTLGQQVTLSGNAASNAVGKVNDNTNAMYNNADAANAAADAQSKYISNLQKGAAQTIMTNKLIAKGWNIERAKMASQAAFENGGKVSAKDIQIIDMNIAANKKLQASEDAITNAKRGSAKAASAALSQHRKDAKEADRADEEQRNLREQYIYAYADREKQIELSLSKEINEIRKANFANPEPFLEAANKRAYYEKQIYLSQLQFEINEFQMSEEQKLKYSYDIKKLQLHQNSEITEKNKEIAINALENQYQHELGLIKLAKEQRIFQAEQAMYPEMDAIRKRYELEREEIIKTANISDGEKARRLSASQFNQKQEEGDVLINTTLNYKTAIGEDVSADRDFIYRQQAINDMYENGLIKQKEYESQSLESMRQYERDKQDLSLNSMSMLLSATSSTWSSMTSLIKDSVGEQSSVYKGMFLAQQAFAITSATINAFQAYNQVLASPWTFDTISKQTAASVTLGMGMANVGMIAAQTIAGFATGGHITGKGTGTSDEIPIMASNGEFMFKTAAVKSLGLDALNYMNATGKLPNQYSDGGLVNPKDTYRVGMGTVDAIEQENNVSGGDVKVSQTIIVNTDGSAKVDTQGQKQLAQGFQNMMETFTRKEMRQGGLIYNFVRGR
ncbi:tape measure protein [Acinetobacter sp. YH12140]|uniref:tape measure protein n=1 Tax=Acinetobacter sp. YH12140 TaxID=2601124 RepID=UPI0015D1C751|nr:tape measure protein [Acinetobacter sp. YH12140]